MLSLSGCVTTSTTASTNSPLVFPGTGTLRQPSGAGPFPAVVLLHTCAGVAPHMYEWADRLRDAGYVALIVNSLSSRGVGYNCDTIRVSVDDVAGDALAALTYLKGLGFVDPRRIGVMGFSFGGMAGLRLASAGYLRNRPEAADGAFKAIISVYPYCVRRDAGRAARLVQYNLYDDIAVPLLILIGGADDHTDPLECAAKAQALAARGQPVSHKVYPNATHGFDQTSSVGQRIRGYLYLYDKPATDDAAEEMRRFFQRHLGAS